MLLAFVTSCSSDDDTVVPIPILEVNECVPYTATDAGAIINGTWSEANERDRYIDEIVIPADLGGGYVKVLLSQSDPDLRPWLTIDNELDVGGAMVSGSSATTNNELVREAYFSVHPGMSYSLEVFPFFNAANYPVDYTLEWEFFSRIDCFENNDTQSQAKKILFDETIEAYAIAGHIDYGVGAFDDQTYDWYKVELNEASVIEAEVLDMPNDMRITMRIFNPDGSTEVVDFEWISPETSNNNGRLSKITSTQVLNPGTYFIELHSDFVQSRVAANDLQPIPNHFNNTYKIEVTKLQ